MKKNLEIKLLIDYEESIPILAKLYHEECNRAWIPNSSVEKTQQKLIEHLNRNKMPLAYVALCNGKPVGMVCLCEKDDIKPGVSPWLRRLVVDPAYRGQGIGKVLVDTIKNQAKKFGYDTLYLLTFDLTIADWCTKLGWKHIGDEEWLNHRIMVMSVPV